MIRAPPKLLLLTNFERIDNMKTDKATIIKNAVNNLMNIFKCKNFPAQIAFSVIHKQKGDVIPSCAWSFGNVLLAIAQGARNADARGFKQWQKVNRHIKKGAKAIHIFAPIKLKIKETDEKTGEEIERVFITGFKPIPVFRVDDTEGEPLPVFDYSPKTYPPFFDVAEKLGIQVSYSPMKGAALGSYSVNNDTINLHANDAVVYYHELAHALHHHLCVDLKKYDRDKAEIVAEFAAVVLCELSDIHGYEQQGYEYIKSYCRNDKPEIVLKKIMQILGDVETIVTKVLEVSAQPPTNLNSPIFSLF